MPKEVSLRSYVDPHPGILSALTAIVSAHDFSRSARLIYAEIDTWVFTGLFVP
jgi:hypothetical protein